MFACISIILFILSSVESCEPYYTQPQSGCKFYLSYSDATCTQFTFQKCIHPVQQERHIVNNEIFVWGDCLVGCCNNNFYGYPETLATLRQCEQYNKQVNKTTAIVLIVIGSLFGFCCCVMLMRLIFLKLYYSAPNNNQNNAEG